MSANNDAPSASLDVAIIGGGIIGLMLAFGLLRHDIRVTVYERSNDTTEIGAGFAFTGIARECMQQLDPRVLEALQRVGDLPRHSDNRYWDGFNPISKEAAQAEDALLFQMPAQQLDYMSCLRPHLLSELIERLPKGVMRYGKQLKSYVDDETSSKVTLSFTDGSAAEADAIIGCDGIRSRTRQLLLGEDNPASYASYTHKVSYRAVVPIAGAIAALGDDKANNQCAHMGPNAHAVSYPVNDWKQFNMVVFLHDPEPWVDADKMTVPATRQEIQHALADWSPAIRELVDLLPNHLTKWGIFDMADNPAPTYARGRVCIAGDAAHASCPFHGVGACMGVEDALAIATSLEMVNAGVRNGSVPSTLNAITSALQAFNIVRLERSRWMTQNLREMGDIYEWRHASTGRDAKKCEAEFERRSEMAWNFDIDNMVAETKSECGRLLNITL